MTFQEVRPGVGMVTRIGTKASFDQDVLHGLPRDPMPAPAHRLNDLGVSPARFFADSAHGSPVDGNDDVTDLNASGFVSVSGQNLFLP